VEAANRLEKFGYNELDDMDKAETKEPFALSLSLS